MDRLRELAIEYGVGLLARTIRDLRVVERKSRYSIDMVGGKWTDVEFGKLNIKASATYSNKEYGPYSSCEELKQAIIDAMLNKEKILLTKWASHISDDCLDCTELEDRP